ncbi:MULTISPECIES: DHA2 family efflux MFS transporter permease subunit [Psychrilyobacter]|uniref:DHA2 family efflux MFS transporter permease subunit n=1 Tax=Psychrilyobacter piezotolerans TaxID=2293438 RepID=A0ABX9KJI5_9FUSO|nr:MULTISPECIES: DHA2 family efflux MFS transporter permease subunit [Psychrilyobacter]MCS5421071.1 DHA2 family efflux MFS transporter permease subunit [Psychrilyobacter sp. S5]NDI76764.1 DHA2 family efflux MFS transporter permease subunit [Psychrilyobacter piezotolerans]RDE65048.1 MFS transporter [Psychrilyobacter sp. S5]REI42618.1 DHA2 family efflux MFS transporter permease subunit [Psychrilyobacter piezotolerans]
MPETNDKITGKIIFITIALATGSFLNMLNASIVNVSLTHIAGDFGIATSESTWIITSYSVAEAIVLPLIGWLTLQFGTVKQYIWSTILFAIASLLCGMSFSLSSMVAARLLQGVVGASMIPLSQTLIMKIFPKKKQGIGIAIWTMTLILGPILGPVIGGAITDGASWRWCFYFSIPLCLLSSGIIYYMFKEEYASEKFTRVKADFIGIFLLISGIGSLQVFLEQGTDLDWFSSPSIVMLAITSFMSLVILGIWEWYHENPVINVRLFLNKNFTIGVISLLIVSAAFYMTAVILPFWLQNVMGYTAFISGKTTATLGLPILFLSPIIGKYTDRIDNRHIAITGFIIFAIVSFFTANYSLDVTSGYVSYTRALSGIGLAFFFVALNNVSLGSINPVQIVAAAGIFNFMRNLGNSIGSSLFIPLWNHSQAYHHEVLASHIHTGNPSFLPLINSVPGSIQAKLVVINGLITKEAATMGVNDVLLVAGLIILALVPFMLLANRAVGSAQGGH